MNQIVVTRGDRIESVHVVHVAVVDPAGRIIASVGDPDRPVFLRSAAKPFQALPLVEDGIADQVGMSPRELALACGSHGGQPEHVQTVRTFLGRIGMSEDQLECGPHLPMHEPSAHRLLESGAQPNRIHNNCSGKHAAMLAFAARKGWDPTGYVGAGHPLQDRMLAEVARWSETPTGDIETAVDGCGVVTFELPLHVLAGAFARFGASASRGEEAGRVVGAMVAEPFFVAGDGRLCTDLMEQAGDRVFVKTGAEGVYAAGMCDGAFGVALKVEDGARRANDVALVAALAALGAIGEEDRLALSAHGRPEVLNTLGDAVGELRAELDLPRLCEVE